MKTYLEAYRDRMENNHNSLIELANSVLTIDPQIEIYHYKGDRFLSGLVFLRDETINSVHFHEVPYRWSGCGYKEFTKSNYNLEMPFTVQDVLNTFKSITKIEEKHNEFYRTKDHYLKSCSYLTKYVPK